MVKRKITGSLLNGSAVRERQSNEQRRRRLSGEIEQVASRQAMATTIAPRIGGGAGKEKARVGMDARAEMQLVIEMMMELQDGNEELVDGLNGKEEEEEGASDLEVERRRMSLVAEKISAVRVTVQSEQKGTRRRSVDVRGEAVQAARRIAMQATEWVVRMCSAMLEEEQKEGRESEVKNQRTKTEEKENAKGLKMAERLGRRVKKTVGNVFEEAAGLLADHVDEACWVEAFEESIGTMVSAIGQRGCCMRDGLACGMHGLGTGEYRLSEDESGGESADESGDKCEDASKDEYECGDACKDEYDDWRGRDKEDKTPEPRGGQPRRSLVKDEWMVERDVIEDDGMVDMRRRAVDERLALAVASLVHRAAFRLRLGGAATEKAFAALRAMLCDRSLHVGGATLGSLLEGACQLRRHAKTNVSRLWTLYVGAVGLGGACRLREAGSNGGAAVNLSMGVRFVRVYGDVMNGWAGMEAARWVLRDEGRVSWMVAAVGPASALDVWMWVDAWLGETHTCAWRDAWGDGCVACGSVVYVWWWWWWWWWWDRKDMWKGRKTNRIRTVYSKAEKALNGFLSLRAAQGVLRWHFVSSCICGQLMDGRSRRRVRLACVRDLMEVANGGGGGGGGGGGVWASGVGSGHAGEVATLQTWALLSAHAMQARQLARRSALVGMDERERRTVSRLMQAVCEVSGGRAGALAVCVAVQCAMLLRLTYVGDIERAIGGGGGRGGIEGEGGGDGKGARAGGRVSVQVDGNGMGRAECVWLGQAMEMGSGLLDGRGGAGVVSGYALGMAARMHPGGDVWAVRLCSRLRARLLVDGGRAALQTAHALVAGLGGVEAASVYGSADGDMAADVLCDGVEDRECNLAICGGCDGDGDGMVHGVDLPVAVLLWRVLGTSRLVEMDGRIGAAALSVCGHMVWSAVVSEECGRRRRAEPLDIAAAAAAHMRPVDVATQQTWRMLSDAAAVRMLRDGPKMSGNARRAQMAADLSHERTRLLMREKQKEEQRADDFGGATGDRWDTRFADCVRACVLSMCGLEPCGDGVEMVVDVSSGGGGASLNCRDERRETDCVASLVLFLVFCCGVAHLRGLELSLAQTEGIVMLLCQVAQNDSPGSAATLLRRTSLLLLSALCREKSNGEGKVLVSADVQHDIGVFVQHACVARGVSDGAWLCLAAGCAVLGERGAECHGCAHTHGCTLFCGA